MVKLKGKKNVECRIYRSSKEVKLSIAAKKSYVLPPSQIISHSNFLGESKHFKFDQIRALQILVKLDML
jgi:hypothetical protein